MLLFWVANSYIWVMEEENDRKLAGGDMGDALEAFFGQFGQLDAYSLLVLEEFFRELMGEEE
jgi:hypothetical protein